MVIEILVTGTAMAVRIPGLFLNPSFQPMFSMTLVIFHTENHCVEGKPFSSMLSFFAESKF